jgi:hypothetical protein
MAHSVTDERYCLRWHACDWGNDSGEFYCRAVTRPSGRVTALQRDSPWALGTVLACVLSFQRCRSAIHAFFAFCSPHPFWPR